MTDAQLAAKNQQTQQAKVPQKSPTIEQAIDKGIYDGLFQKILPLVAVGAIAFLLFRKKKK